MSDENSDAVGGTSILVLAVWIEGGLGIGALGLSWLCGIRLLPGQPRLSWGAAVAWGAATVIPLVLLGCGLDRWGGASVDHIRRLLQAWLVPWLRQSSWAARWCVALLAGAGEELMFRGVLQQGLAGWLTPVGALVLASALFGVCHAVTPLYAGLATGIGLVLGGLLMGTGHLLAPFVTHTLYDGLLFEYFRFAWRDPPEGPITARSPVGRG